MLGRVVALIALPMTGLLAQAGVDVRITAAKDAQYIIRFAADSARPVQNPIMARGDVTLTARGPDVLPENGASS